MKNLLLILALALSGHAFAYSPPTSVMNAPWTLPGNATGPFTAAVITKTSGAASGMTIVAGVSGKTIIVVGYQISTDTAGEAILHHQSGACVFATSGITCNYVGGGMFSAGGGSEPYSVCKPGLGQNQPVCLDVNAAMTTVIAAITYYLY